MKDDIVPRLREQYYTCECFGFGDCSRCESDKQAANEIERLQKEMFRWKSIAERIHELVFTDYDMSGDITEVIMDIENEWAELQYHVDVCRDLGLVPSRVPFRRLGE